MLHEDRTQAELLGLFYELRSIKRQLLPKTFDDKVRQAKHDEYVRDEIKRVEDEIERVLKNARSTFSCQNDDGILGERPLCNP